MECLLEGIIEKVITQPVKVKPIIVNFLNGELKDEEANKMSCGLFYDKKKDKTLLAISNGKIVYKGYKPDNRQQLFQTMFVLHNKRTRKIRLVPAERWFVNPVLHKRLINYIDNSATDDKIALLIKKFGSKKAQRKVEQLERMKININAMKDDLEKAVSNIKIDKEDLQTYVENNAYIPNTSLPPCNRDATDVRDVYNINDILPEEKLATLYEKAKDINNGIEGKSKYFTHAITVSKSDPEIVKKTALLLYIEAVGKWLNMPIKEAKKRGINVCPESPTVNSYIIDTYSIPSSSGRSRPNSAKDKAIIHCMILGFFISNFVLDLEIFATIVNNRIGLKKMKTLARILLAIPSRADKKVFCLQLPLPKPVPVIRKGGKKQFS